MLSTDASRTARRPLATAEPADVMQRFHEHRDLANRLAHRYARSADVDDLRQVAEIALLLAARRFDPELGAFERYAVVTIVGELKKHLRQNAWSVHVPRRVQEHALAVQNSIDRLSVERGRSPRLSEVATDCRLSSEQVSEAMRARSARYSRGDLAVECASANRSPEAAADDLAVRDAVAQLDAADRELIGLAFDDQLTQRQIGERIGISQSQVQRRLARVLAVLRNGLDDEVTLRPSTMAATHP
ncbi:MAG: sigma-70 family RNA polymerase sigma factor [Ilumatobacteraceae bacterium]